MAKREAALGTLCGVALAVGVGLFLDPVFLRSEPSRAGRGSAETSRTTTPGAPAEPTPAGGSAPGPSPVRSAPAPTPEPGEGVAPAGEASGRVNLLGFTPPPQAQGLSLEVRRLPAGTPRRVSLSELSSLRLAPGRYELRLQAPGFVTPAPQLVSVSLGAAVAFRPPSLQLAYVLRGRVEGPPHLSLRGVELELRSKAGADRREEVACEADGAFAQGDLPEGAYRVRARVAEEGEVYLSAWAEARVGEAAGRGPKLRLARAEPVLVGRVFGALGAPLAGATLRLEREEAESDAEGRYQLYGLESGFGSLEVEAEGYLKVRREVVLGSGTGLDFNLTPLSVVEGRVRDEAGRVQGARRVVLFQIHGPNAHTSQSVLSDAEGRFRFEPLLPGDYALGDDPALEPLTPTFQLEAGRTQTVSLRARPGH